MPGLEDINCKGRLDRLEMFILECQMLSGDLVEVYKIMRSIDEGNS